MHSAELDHAQLPEDHVVRETCGAARPHLVTPPQEMPHAVRDVVIDRPIRLRPSTIAEVCRHVAICFGGRLYRSWRKDRAFEWLEKAYDEHVWWLWFLKLEPLFDSLRSDPRFVTLLEKMKLNNIPMHPSRSMIETDGSVNRIWARRGEREKNAAGGAPGAHRPTHRSSPPSGDQGEARAQLLGYLTETATSGRGSGSAANS